MTETHARASDPWTSHAAVPDAITMSRQEVRVLWSYARYGDLTDHEAYRLAGLTVAMNGARQRCSGLRQKHLTMPTGEYGRSPADKSAMICRITQAGRDHLTSYGISPDMPGLHSAILGGSNAERLMRCPASYMEQMRSPAGDVESSYAAEGTALHNAVAHLIEYKVPAQNLLDAVFYEHNIDTERVGVLEQALQHLYKILNAYGGVETFKVVGIEETLSLPGVTGAFGSVDLVMTNEDTVVVCDWKFGGGVAVKAVYEDDQGEYLNPQLAFYTAAARAKFARKFKGKTIVCAIIQPRILPGYTVAETDDKELDAFLVSFREAFIEALTRAPHRERGEWCRFATCKATCPLWTGPVLDLAAIDPTRVALKESVAPTDYGAFLSRALRMADVAENWIVEIRRQGHVFLENGGVVPDFKLVPKRATRKWINPDVVEDVLSGCGAKPEDIWSEPTLRSVAQAETALKKRGISLPADLYHAVSSGTTIAPADDRRPDVSQAEVSKDLRQALAYLRADGDSAQPT